MVADTNYDLNRLMILAERDLQWVAFSQGLSLYCNGFKQTGFHLVSPFFKQWTNRDVREAFLSEENTRN